MGFKGLSYLQIHHYEYVLKILDITIQDMKTSKKTYKGYAFVLEYILDALQKNPVIFIHFDGQEIDSILTFINNNLNTIIDEKNKITLKDSLKNEMVSIRQHFKNTYLINYDYDSITYIMEKILPYVIAIKSISLFMRNGLHLPFEPSHRYQPIDFEYILHYLYKHLYDMTQEFACESSMRLTDEWAYYDFLKWLCHYNMCNVEIIHRDLID